MQLQGQFAKTIKQNPKSLSPRISRLISLSGEPYSEDLVETRLKEQENWAAQLDLAAAQLKTCEIIAQKAGIQQGKFKSLK